MQASVKLDELELAAWRGLLRAHASLVRALDEELQTAHGLALSSYEVLLLLHEAPGRRLRMTELAESALLSLSGMTRLVDRLERGDFVAREPCETDRRVTYARLTPAGLELFRRARVTHLRGVRARFHSQLSEDEQRALAAIWPRLAP